MPHTTTKSHRTKRPDTRPNGKIRARLTKENNAKLTIQDIRTTSKRAGEKKEREVSTATPLNILTKEEKLLRALKKKLKGINDLKEKQDRGESLDLQQTEKLSQLPTLLTDMEALMKKNDIAV
jgi:uncharacterized protein with WD repeat